MIQDIGRRAGRCRRAVRWWSWPGPSSPVTGRRGALAIQRFVQGGGGLVVAASAFATGRVCRHDRPSRASWPPMGSAWPPAMAVDPTLAVREMAQGRCT